jgi:hypothetical protein
MVYKMGIFLSGDGKNAKIWLLRLAFIRWIIVLISQKINLITEVMS